MLKHALFATSAIVILGGGFAVPALAADPAPEPTKVDEVVVTANKREESIQAVANTVTAFRATELLNSGRTSFTQYADFVPGLQINTALGGNPVIRGLTQGVDAGATVAIILNGAPLGSSSSYSAGGVDSLNLDPIDIQRVEVLRGPQGTLYGANSLGGLLSYTLRDPDLSGYSGEARAEVATTREGEPSYSIRGGVSGALVEDRLGVRVSGYSDHAGGFIDNKTRGLEDFNSSQRSGVQGSILWKPQDNVRAMLSAFHQEVTQDGTDAVIYNNKRSPRDGDLRFDDRLINTYNKKADVVLATLDVDFSVMKFSSISTWQKIKSGTDLDASNGTLAFVSANVLPLFGAPSFPNPVTVGIGLKTDTEKRTQEFRLTSNGDGKLQWIAGVFWSKEDVGYSTYVNGRTATGVLVPSLNPSLAFDVTSSLKDLSIFGDLTYAFSDKLDVTLGLRAGRIEQDFRQLFSGSQSAAYNLLLFFSGVTPTPADTGVLPSKEDIRNYLATARYRFSPHSMVFVRYATGYRPGGANFRVVGLPETFSSDSTENYEVGYKADYFDGRLVLDLTAYYLKWKDILVTCASGGVGGFCNGKLAENRGLEAEAILRPVEGLKITGTAALTDAKLKSDIFPGSPSQVGLSGDPLPYTPKFRGTLSADYRRPLRDGWDGVLAGSIAYQGARESTLRGSATFPRYRLPAYTLVDLRAGVEKGGVSANLFVRNLFDERAQTAIYAYYGINEVTVNRPRTLGVNLAYRF